MPVGVFFCQTFFVDNPIFTLFQYYSCGIGRRQAAPAIMLVVRIFNGGSDLSCLPGYLLFDTSDVETPFLNFASTNEANMTSAKFPFVLDID